MPAALDGGGPHFSGSRIDVNVANINTMVLGGGTPISVNGSTIGSGDDVVYFVTGTAWMETIVQGTAAFPVNVGSGPTLKVERTESIPEATMPAGVGANNQGNAAIWGAATGDINNQAQVAGILGTATNASTQTTHNDDACGIQGQGNITGTGTGVGIGGYFNGRRSTDTGAANGVEIRCSNFTATDSPFVTNGFSLTTGLWLTAGGNSPSAVACCVGIPGSGQTWHVGFAAISTSVTDQTFRDESQSTTSILINGTHTTAIATAATAGQVLIGGTSSVYGVANNLVEVQGSNNDVSGLVAMGSVGNTKSYTLLIRNAAGQSSIGIVGSANSLLTGTIAGDAVFRDTTSGKAIHFGNTKSAIKVGGATADTVTFFATDSTPAGGGAALALLLGSALGIYFGSGAPSVSAAKGSLYLRNDGTTTNDRAYINTNGSTTWTALTTVA